MYVIEISLQCPSKGCEVFPEDVAATELLVENIICLALLELFDSVLVSEVNMKLIRVDHEGEKNGE